MSKTILADVDGFTPVIDRIADELGLTSAAVFGRMWRFCQMEDGVCKASLETIATGLGIDRATVMRHADKLCEAKYLKDLTPDARNVPHVYADTGKAGIRVNITVAQRNSLAESVAQSNATVAESNKTVAESKLKKVLNTDSNDTMGGLSEKELSQANGKVTAIIEAARTKSYQNRDKIPEPLMAYADLYNKLTGQEPTKRVLSDWLLTFSEWQAEGLQLHHIEFAYKYACRPEGGFLVARPASLTNTAVAMKSKAHAVSATNRSSVEATQQYLAERDEQMKHVLPPAKVAEKIKELSRSKAVK